MKWLIYAVSITVLFILHLAISDLRVFPMPPNLVLVYICLLLVYASFSDAIWVAVISGVFMDIFSGLNDGVMVLSILGSVATSYYIIQSLASEKMVSYQIPIHVILTSVLLFVYMAGINAVLSLFQLNIQFNLGELLTKDLLFSVIINLAALYPVYWFYSLQTKIQKLLIPKHESI